MKQKSTLITAAASGLILLVMVGALLVRFTNLGDRRGERVPEIGPVVLENRPVKKQAPPATLDPQPDNAQGRGMFAFSESVLQMLLRAMVEGNGALDNEVILRFKDDEAYRKFLASGGGQGMSLLGSMDGLLAVRLGFDSYRELSAVLDGLDGVEMMADANYLVTVPTPPNSGDSPGAGAGAVPIGRGALESLGITGDNANFGAGVTVAVLDSGVQEHSVFEGSDVRSWNMVFDEDGAPLEIDPANGHGTAVASIIASSDERLRGVAPQAKILDVRILDNTGETNSFRLAEGLIWAVDSGADVINVSLGSFGDSGVVRDAVAYANEGGVLIVASAGNEGANQVSFPAALDGVVAVAASDARGQHLDFSNSGEALVDGGFAAPGYEVTAAWPGEMGINFSGTSASAPLVSGGIAAVMSQNQGMTAQQAYEALLTHSNEAGAPGADQQYGVGNLNVGRVLNANTPGISDFAVASVHYDSAATTGTAGFAQVVVENRGTTPLRNVPVEVNSGAGDQTFNVSYLDVGDISVIETPIDASSGDVPVSVNAMTAGDTNPANDSFQRVISFE